MYWYEKVWCKRGGSSFRKKDKTSWWYKVLLLLFRVHWMLWEEILQRTNPWTCINGCLKHKKQSFFKLTFNAPCKMIRKFWQKLVKDVVLIYEI